MKCCASIPNTTWDIFGATRVYFIMSRFTLQFVVLFICRAENDKNQNPRFVLLVDMAVATHVADSSGNPASKPTASPASSRSRPAGRPFPSAQILPRPTVSLFLRPPASLPGPDPPRAQCSPHPPSLSRPTASPHPSRDPPRAQPFPPLLPFFGTHRKNLTKTPLTQVCCAGFSNRNSGPPYFPVPFFPGRLGSWWLSGWGESSTSGGCQWKWELAVALGGGWVEPNKTF